MKLHEILKEFPPEMVFRSHSDGAHFTVADLLKKPNESNCRLSETSFHYGRVKRKAIVAKVGSDCFVLYTEVK